MSHVGSTLVSTSPTTTTTRSRLAQRMGFTSAEATSSKAPTKSQEDEDWYIPYNGPIEPPPQRRRPRGNTFGGPDTAGQDRDGGWEDDEEDNTFGYGGAGTGRPRASSNARSFASSSSHSHSPSHGYTGIKTFFGGSGGGIGEAPVNSAASTRDRTSTYSARPFSTYSTRDRGSTFSADSDREREREQRGSVASFLTFGQGARKPGFSINTARNMLFPAFHSFSPVSPRALSPSSSPQVIMLSPTTGSRSNDSQTAFVFPPVPRQVQDRRGEEGASRPHRNTPFHPHPQSQMQRNGAIGAWGRGERDEFSARLGNDGNRRGSLEGRGRTSDGDHGRGSIDGLGPSPVSANTAQSGSSSENHGYGIASARRAGETAALQGGTSDAEEIEKMPSLRQPLHPLPQARLQRLSHSSSYPVLPSVNVSSPPQSHPQPHPYAVAFPSIPPPPQAFSLSAGTSARKPRPPAEMTPHFNNTTSSTSHLHPYSQSPHTNFHGQAHAQREAYAQGPIRITTSSTSAISPAAIAAALKENSRRGFGSHSQELKPSKSGSLKASISTPNLRSLFGMGNGTDKGGERGLAGKRGEKPNPKQLKTQYEAETWCDALMFPRPRFRAHVISPPSSPTDNVTGREKGDATAQAMSARARGATKPILRRAMTVNNVQSPSPNVGSSVSPPRTPPRSNYLSTDPHSTPQRQPAPSSPKHNLVLTPSKDSRVSRAPTEELVRRVIVEGEQRDQEREKWNELARSSFQNRRSRSLSRTRSRKRSGAATEEREHASMRVRVESDAGAARPRTGEAKTTGLARSLTVGLTTLAAEAFNQPTPTISTASASHSGGTESNAHSRSTSDSMGHRHAHGHTRNTSWGKVALKSLCSPEDAFSDAAVTPQEKQEKLEGALMHQKTAKMRVRGRKEEAEEADVQFLDIAPLPPGKEPRQNASRQRLDVENDSGRSRSQNSNVSDSLDVPGVGIALSTPPNPSPVDQGLPDLSAHPYAQPSAPRTRAEPVPVSATYAGPHPTSHDYNKHRLPPHVQLETKPPEERMYAALESGVVRQVLTPEIVQSPSIWDRSRGPSAYGSTVSPSAYAYANVVENDKRESTLGVEEALLSRAFQRGGGSAEDSGIGSVDDHEMRCSPPVRESSPVPTPLTPRSHPKPVALNAYSGIPSLSHTVTTAAHTDVPEPDVLHVVHEPSTALSSPSSRDSGSSQISPRLVGSMDDLEPFRDLFYKPGRPGSESAHQRTPSSERRKMFSTRDPSGSWGEDRIKSIEGLNGLRSLARQLSDDSPGLPSEAGLSEKEHRGQTHGQDSDGLQEERMEGQFPLLPGLNDESLQIGSPLRSEYHEGQDFPEDIQSSRASSIMEHEAIDETLRLGTVSPSVPATTQPTQQRQSTTLSIGDTEDGGSLRPNRDTVITATSSHGIPGTVDDLLRTSFVTSTSSTSHMSNLIGDFPTPPLVHGVTSPSPTALESYFVDSRPVGSRLHASSSLGGTSTRQSDTSEP